MDKRIDYIAKRQDLLASAVDSLQRQLYEAVLSNFDKIATDPAELDQLWRKFQASAHSKVILKFASDVMQIGKLNADYFKEVASDLDSKDYASIKKTADSYLMDRFGLAANGKAVKDGFLDTFVKDQSILRDLKQYAYKAQVSGIGVDEFKQGFKDMITGTEAKNGSLMRYYQTFAFDTYQQADATLQDHYAKSLDLEAALYLGGEITGTRPFCHDRNGKVFLRSEIEDWRGIKFAGKPANYDPFQDRGGYNCRHHFNWITNKMAVARRSDLMIGEDGRLKVKGETAPAKTVEVAPEVKASGFKPAASIEDAVQFAKENKIAKFVDFGEANLDQANEMNKILFDVHSKYKISELDRFAVEAGSSEKGRISSTANGMYNYYPDANNKFNAIVINKRQLKDKDIIPDYESEMLSQLAEWNKAKEQRPELFNGATKAAKANRKNLKEIEEAAKFKRWSVTSVEAKSPYKRTLTHELGHKIHDDIFGLEGTAYRKTDLIPVFDDALELNKELLSLFNKSKANGDIYKVSAYSNSNSSEFFAESFSMFEIEPDQLPGDIKLFINKVLSYARK